MSDHSQDPKQAMMSHIAKQLKAKFSNTKELSANADQSTQIVYHLSRFIKYNKQLLHLDLSHTGLTD